MHFFHSIKKILGLGYRLGARYTDDNKEVDCFGMVCRYIFLRYRVNLPFLLDGKSGEQYYEEASGDKQKLVAFFIKYLNYNFVTVNKLFFVAGDVIVADESEDIPTVGIVSGGSSMVTAIPNIGTITVPLSDYEITRAFRWAGQ